MPGSLTNAFLYQNIPNPFREKTDIRFYLPQDIKEATLYIFNLQGKTIKSINVLSRGENRVTINGSELSAGMYVYSLVADGREIDSKRMILTD